MPWVKNLNMEETLDTHYTYFLTAENKQREITMSTLSNAIS